MLTGGTYVQVRVRVRREGEVHVKLLAERPTFTSFVSFFSILEFIFLE
jgi:hypothetical protein